MADLWGPLRHIPDGALAEAEVRRVFVVLDAVEAATYPVIAEALPSAVGRSERGRAALCTALAEVLAARVEHEARMVFGEEGVKVGAALRTHITRDLEDLAGSQGYQFADARGRRAAAAKAAETLTHLIERMLAGGRGDFLTMAAVRVCHEERRNRRIEQFRAIMAGEHAPVMRR